MVADARNRLPVLIGTKRYDVDWLRTQRRPLDSIRQQVDQGTEPGEQSFSNFGIWKRTQSDFVGGAGQDYFDQEDENDRRRFRKSKGLDVFTNRRKACLLPDTESVTTVGNGDSGVMLGTSSGLYVASGTAMKFGASPKSSMSGITGWSPSGTIGSIALWGSRVYACDGADVYRATAGSGAFSSFSSEATDYLTVAKGRLLGMHDNGLFELDNLGAKVGSANLYDHPDSGFVFTGAKGAPNGIYVWGDSDDNSEVLLVTVADAAGDLVAPYPVGETFAGEKILDMEYYGGLMFLATTLGVRLATIDASGSLTPGPLIDDFGRVECILGYGRFIYCGWTNYDGTSTGLAVLSPDTFTQTLVPAWSSHLMYTDQGTVRDLAVVGGELYYGFDTGSVLQVVAESSTDYVSSGSMHSGGITYGTPELKSWLGGEAQWESLPTGSSVVMELLDGIDGSATTIISNTTAGSTSEAAELSTAPESEEQEIKITVNRGVFTTSRPCLKRWTSRVMPLPFRAEEIVLVVNMHEEIDYNGRVQIKQNVNTEITYLLGLMRNRSRVPVEIGFTGESLTCIVDAVGTPDQMPGLVKMAGEQEEWPQGWWAVRLITAEVA